MIIMQVSGKKDSLHLQAPPRHFPGSLLLMTEIDVCVGAEHLHDLSGISRILFL